MSSARAKEKLSSMILISCSICWIKGANPSTISSLGAVSAKSLTLYPGGIGALHQSIANPVTG